MGDKFFFLLLMRCFLLVASPNHLINIIINIFSRKSIGSWFLITFLSVYYKIMAKYLALRVQDVTNKVFYQEQIGFVLGRFILDIVLFAWEAMEKEKELG